MKQTFYAIWMALVLGSVLIPASIVVTSGRPEMTQSVAIATAAATGGGSGGTAATGTNCVDLSVGVNSASDKKVCDDGSGGGVIIAYLKLILKFLSGGVGIVILLMLTIAGVQYMTAAGQPEQVKAAKSRIQNAITGLVLFLIAFAVLNFIIPGSIFG